MSKIHNFSAGPAILPQAAIDASVEALQNFAGTGLSLLEVSHRSKEYEAVVEEACQLVKDILGLNDDYAVVFLQGGASLQFDMLPMNFWVKTKPQPILILVYGLEELLKKQKCLET